MSKQNVSAIRQNFQNEVEANLNRQINVQLKASYIFQSMAYYFNRDDVSLPGFSKFFKKNSEEEKEAAEKFMKYLNKRGGRVYLQDVPKPFRDEWNSPLDALEVALSLEKEINDSFLSLHSVGSNKNDPHFCDFMETEFLDDQVKSIKKLSEMITKLKRVGTGLGEYLLDKDLQ